VKNYVPVTDEMLRNQDPGDWLMARRNYQGWSHSPLTQVTRDNVKELQLAWVWAMNEGQSNEPSPVVHNGIIYLTNTMNTVQALDARTGDLIWENHLGPNSATGIAAMRNMAIYQDKVFVATTDARLTALDARIIFDAGAYAGAPVGIAALLLGGYYTVPNLRIRGFEVLTHKPGVGAYRAPGAVQATFALESLMDELALKLGIDPLDLRLLNACREGDLLPTGRPWPKIGLVQCLERLRTERQRLNGARQGSPRDGVRRGVGVAVGGWLGGIEPASAVCRLDRDGTLTVVLGMVDMSGAATGMAQIAAEAAGLPLDDVTVVCADTESAPFAGSSGGSKITYTVGLAVERAARDARRQILAIAADRLEAAADDLEIVGRSVRVRGMPDRGVTLAQIARSSMEFGAKYEPVFGRGASATTARSPAFAAHLAEVEVDTDTGRVRVVRQVVVQDVGRAINPAAIAAQIHGAVAQGVGWALLEGMSYDAHGQLRSATLMDYALPSITDAPPEVETVILEVPTEHGPFGAKGVGEPPVVAAPAAIANAIADAIGRRLTDLPMTSEALARAIDTAKPALSSPNR